MSFLLNESRAAVAAITSGSAASRSFWQDSCLAATSVAITPHFSASICAAAFSSSAFSFSIPTFSAKASELATFSSTMMAFRLASWTSFSTISWVASIFVTPSSRREIFDMVASRFCLRRLMYSLMSSRNVLGVV